MANWIAEIVTPFIGDGSEANPNRPQLGDDYVLLKWEDVTGTPSVNISPDPNLYIIKVEVEPLVLDAIELDGTYLVIWSEEIVREVI